jgi:hypothetical protein
MTDELPADADQLGAHVKRLNLWLDSETEQPYKIETVHGNRWSLRYDLAALLADHAALAETARLQAATIDRDVERIEGLLAVRDGLRRAAGIQASRIDSIRALAEALRKITAFGVASCPADDAWKVADHEARQLCAALGPWPPRAAPQRGAAGAWGGFADAEAAEARSGAQRGPEGFEHEYGYENMDRGGEGPMMIGRTPADILAVMRQQRETFPEATYALRRREVGPWSTVQDERAEIAPEGDGIATSDATAQAAADARVIWRTPETWCAIYGIDIRDPDGWRGPDAPAWEQPITLDEFRRRLASSTVTNAIAAYLIVSRALAKPDREYCPDCELPESNCACG